MNKVLILLFILVLCKLIYMKLVPVREPFFGRIRRGIRRFFQSKPSIKVSDPNKLYNSKLTKDRLQYYFNTINPETGKSDYDAALKNMNNSEKTDYHNLIYDMIADYEREMKAKKAQALEDGKKQIEEQNAKDTKTVLANRDEQLDDINNIFSKQVQANFNQNYQNNLYIREKNIDDIINDKLTEFSDKLYGFNL